MGDALAVISLAGNIVQFVDFSIKLVSTGKELYQSADRALKENVELEEVTADLKLLSQTLTTSAPSYGIPEGGKSLRKLADTCIQLADELIAHLESLKINTDKNRRWESINKSLQSVWKGSKTKDIEARLGKVKEEVLFHLVFLLK
jgi:hypothetical protein